MTNGKQGSLDMPRAYLDAIQSGPKYKWYKPLLAMIVTAAVYGIFAVVILTAGQALQLPEFTDGTPVHPGAYLNTDFAKPLEIFFASLGVAAMIPAVAIGVKVTGLGSLKGISSVAGGLRWDRMVKLAVPIFVLTGIIFFGETVIEMVVTGDAEGLTHITFSPLALLAILVFVPFQCAAEEYVFRGLLQQSLAAWMSSIVIVIVLQSVAFGFSHSYSLLGNAGIVLSGVLWGWLTIKTGGLEASICLHSANNVFAFAMSSLFVAGGTVSAEVSVAAFFFDIFLTSVMAAMAYFICKKNGYFLEGKEHAA